MGKVRRMATSFSGVQKSFSIPKLTLDQNVASSASENASLLALIFSETSQTTNYSTCFIRRKLEFERNTPPLIPFHIESPDPINLPFSMRELKRAINSKKQSATGVDEISYVMLKHLGDENLEVILHLLNSSWTNGEIPESWSRSIIVPILKPGKPSTSATSYRPVALTSHLSKILETMVSKRLIWFLEWQNILSTSQSGFRSQWSTLDHIVALHDEAVKSTSNGK